MSARTRLGLGAMAVVLGIAAWVAIRVLAVQTSAEARDALPSLRWSAVVLAVGGLVLVVRGWRRGVGSAIGLGLAWLGADTALSGTAGSTAVVATAVAVAAPAVVVLRAGHNRGDVPGWVPVQLGYVGVLLGGSLVAYDRGYWPPLGAVRWAAWLVVCGMVLLAPALALSAAPLRASRGRRLAAAALVVPLVVPPAISAATADEVLYVGPAAELRTILADLLLVGCVVVLAMLVALTGPLRRGRTLAALVVAGAPIVMTIVFGIDAVEPTSVPPGRAWLLATAASVGATLVGVVAVAGAGLIRNAGPPAAPGGLAVPVPPSAAPARPDWRRVLGAVVAVVGVAAWLVMALWVHPAITAGYAYWDGQSPYGEYGAAADFAGLGWDARLSAVVLAAGGLRLAAGNRPRRRIVLVCVGGWVALDVLLSGGGVDEAAVRPIALVVAAAVVAGVLALVVVPVPRGVAEAGRRSPWSLVYCGVSGGAGVLLLQDAATWMRAAVDSRMMPAVCALSVALAVAAVLTALSATPAAGGRMALGGACFAIVATAAVAALDLIRVAGHLHTDGSRELASGLVLGCLVLGCAVLGGYVPRTKRPQAWVGAVGATVVGGPIAVAGAVVAAHVGDTLLDVVVAATRVVKVNTPFASGEGASPLTLAGLLAGATIALAALLPRALSTSDDCVAARAEPPALAPVAKRAPVARAGVPEILEWPVSG